MERTPYPDGIAPGGIVPDEMIIDTARCFSHADN